MEMNKTNANVQVNHTGHRWGIVLAGGRGSRLPIAGSIPKQFAPKFDDCTFVQDIVSSISKSIKPNRIIIVVTNDEQQELAIKQLTPLGVPSTNVVMFDPHFGYVAVMAMACDYITSIDPDATVFISPSDQHIVGVDKFVADINAVTKYAKEDGESVLLGVKVADANIVGGCGNAVYDASEPGPIYEISEFIEKPLKKFGEEYVKKMLIADNSVVNTGFYALKAKQMCFHYPKQEMVALLEKYYAENSEATDLGLNPENMMKALGMKLVVGGFSWADCGTLSAYYGIQRKTPNHCNASIGEVSRFECRDSLFVSSTKGIKVYATGIKDGLAVVAYATKAGGINVAVMDMAESQEVGKVTDFFEKGERASYSYNSENCIVMPSNLSATCKYAFLGVQNIYVYVNRLDSGDINVNVASSGNCVHNTTTEQN